VAEKKSIVPLVILVIVFLIIGFAGGYIIAGTQNHQSTKSIAPLSVFAAGSLKYALGDNFKPTFENLTGIQVGMTFSGSVGGAREVTAGTPYDVFISAAAGVIPQILMPNYTKWMVIFSSNEMAVTWTNSSYNIPSNQFWFENISAPHIIVAASNASLDPSGFQAIEMIKLAGILYTNWSNPYVKEAFENNFSQFMVYNKAWNQWFGPNGQLAKDNYGGNYPNNDSMALYDQLFQYKLKVGDLKLTTVEIGLDGYLQSGAADYALTYKSQAINQGLNYYKNSKGGNGLPGWINLGSVNRSMVEFYTEVNSSGPSVDNIGNFPGGPILYSATILINTKNQAVANQFIYYLITSLGQSYLSSSEFDPIATPFLYGQGPSFLSGITIPVPSYIPTSSYEEI